MREEPERGSNSHDASLSPTQQREVIRYTLLLQREYLRLWGREITVSEVEQHLAGTRTL